MTTPWNPFDDYTDPHAEADAQLAAMPYTAPEADALYTTATQPGQGYVHPNTLLLTGHVHDLPTALAALTATLEEELALLLPDEQALGLSASDTTANLTALRQAVATTQTVVERHLRCAKLLAIIDLQHRAETAEALRQPRLAAHLRRLADAYTRDDYRALAQPLPL